MEVVQCEKSIIEEVDSKRKLQNNDDYFNSIQFNTIQCYEMNWNTYTNEKTKIE